MKLELCNGSYFIFVDETPNRVLEYDLRMWLYRNGFEGNIECRPAYTFHPSYFSPDDQYNTYYNPYDNPYNNPYNNPYYNPYYIETRQENGYLLNYRYLKCYTNDAYKTEFIKIGMCIVSTGSHLLFLNPGEYEILQSGLKILPNE